MTSDQQALLQSVLAEPAADAPRLVYADWLEEFCPAEADQARARFIRLEVEAEQHPLTSLERSALEGEAAILFAEYADTWNAGITGWSSWYESHLIYRRGFPDELQANLRRFAFGAEDLLPQLPLRVLSLHYGTAVASMGCLYSVEPRLNLAAIHTLRVNAGLSVLKASWSRERTVLVKLLDHTSLHALYLLDCSNCGLTLSWLRDFAKVLPTLRAHALLEALDLSNNLLDSASAYFLATAKQFEQIRSVDLRGNPIDSRSHSVLASRFGDGLLI